MWDIEETIVAIASPTSPAPRGIIRMSGTDSLGVLSRLGFSVSGVTRPTRISTTVDLGTPIGQIPVDAMLWPTPRSYTGQPSAELHTIGSLPLLTRLTQMAVDSGARAARPGEFTMRAFLAGRLDLTQAEAVLGVIDAEGRGSLDHALRQLSGNLSKPLESMRSTLLDLLADVEAGLDFVDEDIEFVSDEVLIQRLTEIRITLAQTSETMQDRGGGSARINIALRGEPNAGKSQLLNSLTETETAIVADVAGTTRDIVTVDATVDGHLVRWIDTAGMEMVIDDISRQSQDQGTRAAGEADLRLWCVDSSRSDFLPAMLRLQEESKTTSRAGAVNIFVATKSDLVADEPDGDWISCSSKTGTGLGQLIETIVETIQGRDGEEVGSVVGTAARCRQSLAEAERAIEAAIGLAETSQGHEFVSAEMRLAAQCLGEVTGAVYTDDILDRVFGRFCIGK
ncbi:tRNA modification GTPase MnmE [Rubripirellula reticaptiva]|uniref:tRNA modification GTPase MnmE n=1 Tax=Rubripirellula reticaptiva TaxID=2528013 RepID=A0A5C6F1Y5_9BACT|nr:tRNA modification GTPase MnmE [Rubripirellula reticaptiva]